MNIIDNRSCKIMRFCELKQYGCFIEGGYLYLKTGESTAFNMEEESFSTFSDKEEITPVSVTLIIEDYKE